MKMRMSHIISMAAVAVMLGALPVVTACSGDDGPDEPAKPGVEKPDVWLSVDIRNLLDAPTRADAPDDGSSHPDESAIPAENYINVNDLSVMLLNSDGELVRTFSSDEFNLAVEGAGNTSYDTYNLKVKADAALFDFGGADTKDYSLVIVANMNGTGEGDGPFGHNHLFNTLPQLSDLYRGFPYNATAASQPWTPSIADGRFIPMAGTVTTSVTATALKAATTADNALKLPDIYMQRSMAQVRLLDALSFNPDCSDYKVTDVKLRGFNTRGAYLPALSIGDSWCKNTSVLEHGTAMDTWYDSTTLLNARAFEFTDSNGAVDSNRRTYPAFGFYVPEFSWSAIGTNDGPELQITVQGPDNEELQYVYKFPRTTDDGRDADFARNHIYQVVVSAVVTVHPTTLKLYYGVCPWEEKTITIPDFN